MLPPLVADVNIASRVVQFLRSQGVDVVSACEEGWGPTRMKIFSQQHTR